MDLQVPLSSYSLVLMPIVIDKTGCVEMATTLIYKKLPSASIDHVYRENRLLN